LRTFAFAPRPDDDGLPTVLVRFGQELVHGPSPRFDAVVEGSVRALAPAVLQEAGLIGREALSNAFRHAKADTIELQIEFGQDHFRMRVRDDGVGFDDAALARHAGGRHWGLPGMQERARTISSHLTLWSRPGAGTEVELRVPGQVAYLSASPRRRWMALRSVFWRPT
jgi:signal transduction histidine kinase